MRFLLISSLCLLAYGQVIPPPPIEPPPKTSVPPRPTIEATTTSSSVTLSSSVTISSATLTETSSATSTITTSTTTTSSSSSLSISTTTSSDSSETSSATATIPFTQTAIATQSARPSQNSNKGDSGVSKGLIIAGGIIGAIIILGVVVFIYRKIRGLDDEDFKVDRYYEDSKPFNRNGLSVPDYGRPSNQYQSQQQYAVYPTIGRPGLPGFVEKGRVVESPADTDTNYYGTPDFGYQQDYYNHYHTHPSNNNQYSNNMSGYQIPKPSLHETRQY